MIRVWYNVLPTEERRDTILPAPPQTSCLICKYLYDHIVRKITTGAASKGAFDTMNGQISIDILAPSSSLTLGEVTRRTVAVASAVIKF